MKYKFATLNASGAVCCAGNEPDFPRCARCRAATVRTATTLRTSAPSARVRKTPSEWADHFGRLLGVGSVQISEPENPYREATSRAPRQAEPSDTPGYQPHGEPPDPYAAGIAKLRVQLQAAKDHLS